MKEQKLYWSDTLKKRVTVPEESKAIPDSWETEDDCTACGHSGMTFILGWTENGDEGREHHGILRCSGCGEDFESSCFDYQVPSRPGTRTAEEIDNSIDGRGPDPEDFEN